MAEILFVIMIYLNTKLSPNANAATRFFSVETVRLNIKTYEMSQNASRHLRIHDLILHSTCFSMVQICNQIQVNAPNIT